MPFFKVLAMLAVSSLATAGGAYAGASGGATAGAASHKGQSSSAVAKLPVAKETKPATQAAEEAPIVMGRSVAVVRKSKLHHVKVKPPQPGLPTKN
jgi:hypothetical protein